MSANALPMIEVHGIGKTYFEFGTPVGRLANVFGMHDGDRHAIEKHRILQDVSFNVMPGEAVGIIGRNGAGKSTLLRIVCGTMEPTTGSVTVRGRLAALLELGAGFDPEFSGRENIFLNAALMGMSRSQVESRFNDILEFADIGDYIDQPVKTYSSGMFVRLAFAVIANCDADILVIDEALAVGDVFFTQKCMRFIREFVSSGGTLLFVSHDTSSVLSLCSRAVMLTSGATRVPVVGSADEVCKDYLSRVYEDESRLALVKAQRNSRNDPDKSSEIRIYRGTDLPPATVYAAPFSTGTNSFGLKGATITSVDFLDPAGEIQFAFESNSEVLLQVSISVHTDIIHPAVGFILKDRLGQYVITEGTDARLRQHDVQWLSGSEVKTCFSFTFPNLMAGDYTLDVAVAEGIGHDHVQHHWIHDAIKLEVLGGPAVHGILSPNDTRCQMTVLPPEKLD